MKKILLFSVSILLFSWAFSQSLELYYEGQPIESMSEITIAAHPDSGMMAIDTLDVKNISDVTLDVFCVKEVLEEVENTTNTFCWGGQCYPPFVDTSGSATTIAPMELVLEFVGDYDPSGQTGTTTIKYKFYNIENPDDFVAVIVNYDASESNSVNEFVPQYTLSKAYPNPANNFVNVDYKFTNLQEYPRLVIYNLLGSKVKEIELNESFGTLTVNTSDFIEGIYFYSLLINNEASQTHKLIVKH